MCASKAEGRPVFKNNSLASTPETKPSMSLSVFKKMSWYFILSAGDTTHWGEKKRSFFHYASNNIEQNADHWWACLWWWCFEAYRWHGLMGLFTGCWRWQQMHSTCNTDTFSFRRWHQCWRQRHWHRFLLKSTVHQEHGLKNSFEEVQKMGTALAYY